MTPRMWIALLAVAAAPACAQTFVLRGATVHPVSSPPVPNGLVVVRDGRIEQVGTKVKIPAGARVIDLHGLHVYPGLIDSGTRLGLFEIGSVRETSDTTELGLFKPHLRAVAAVNPASEHIPVTRANGITSVVTQPGGSILAGQAALIHLEGWTPEEMTVRAPLALRMEFPRVDLSSGPRSAAATGPGRSYADARRQYQQRLRELEDFFESARRYQRAKAAGGSDFNTDWKLEAMLPVLEGKLPLLVDAGREKTIREALRFCEKQKVRMILQDGGEAWKVAAELKAKDIPVILGPTLRLPEDEDDPYDRPFTIPAELYKAGVRFAFSTLGPGSGGTNPRNLPYEAAGAVAFGLPRDEALKAVTANAALIWGVADEIGSIEAGKIADLIVTDGDPLETRTEIKQMYIRGTPVDLNNKHRRLYERYLNRP